MLFRVAACAVHHVLATAAPGAAQGRGRQRFTYDEAFAGGAASFANPLTSARKAKAAGIGVNWYLNQNVKWQLDYELTRFDGGAATGDRPDEKALFTRVGVAF